MTTATDIAKEVIRFLDGESEMIESSFAIQNNIKQRFDLIEEKHL